MSLSDLASLGSFISGFAVLVSLVFLYFQLRQLGAQVAQAERNQQATIRQGRAARQVAISMGRATNPSLAEALHKAATGAQDLTATQLHQFDGFARALFSAYEDGFYQNQDGLMGDSAFSAVANAMGRSFSQPSHRVQWKRLRQAFGAEFVEFTDRLIARTPVALRSFDPVEWLTAFAAERSGAPN